MHKKTNAVCKVGQFFFERSYKVIIGFSNLPHWFSSHTDSKVETTLEAVIDFLQDSGGRNLGEPKLVINIIGDIQHAHDSAEYLQSAIKSLFRMTENTWLFVEAYNTELNRTVGRGVTSLSYECNRIINSECNVRVTSVGFCNWDQVVGHKDIEKDQVYDLRVVKQNLRKSQMALNKNNTHYIGVVGSSCFKLRQVLFKRFSVPRANLLVGGGKNTVKTLANLEELSKPPKDCRRSLASGSWMLRYLKMP